MIAVRIMLLASLGLIFSGSAWSQIDVEFDEDNRQHVSLVLGGTSIPSADETAFTIGIDYEYRLNRLIGVGAVVEHAVGDIDATTLLAVADIHIWKGLAIQAGPGVEFADEGETTETFAIGRIGALYEVEIEERFTIAPQVHYDISSGPDAVVFGLALGVAF
ncbi:MAG: hypothetical protein AAFY34_01055 [Pseudomonadota bacterium]